MSCCWEGKENLSQAFDSRDGALNYEDGILHSYSSFNTIYTLVTD
jgi:hypothetical protein